MNPPPPKFAVGEEVLVICNWPTVQRFESIVAAVWWEPVLINNKGAVWSSWVYRLVSSDEIYLEECLFKKPKPDEEFERFMSKLNLTTPIKEGEPA